MNRLLLDSHVLLWLIEPGTRHLTARAREIVISADAVYFSIVSMWEIAIKEAKGRLDIDFDRLIAALDEAGLQELPVRRKHIRTLRALPHHHRDPFDRMLVAQAISEPLHLLTADEKLEAYGDLVVLL